MLGGVTVLTRRHTPSELHSSAPEIAGTSAAQPICYAAGNNATAITAARDQFRTDLSGGLVTGANGLFSDTTGAA